MADSRLAASDVRPSARFYFPRTGLIWALAGGICVFLIVTPLIAIGFWAFTENAVFTLGHVARVLRKAGTLKTIWNTITLGLGVAVISVVVGVPLAVGVSRTNMRWKGLVRATVVFAIITPPFLNTMSYILLMGPNAGFINRFLRLFVPGASEGPINIFSPWGLYFLVSPLGIAYVFLGTTAVLNQMDPSLEEAARISGAGRLKSMLLVTLPMNRNAIIGGALMAFTVTLGLFGTPYILGAEVLTVRIRQCLLMPLDLPAASILSIVVTVLSMVSVFLYRRNLGDQRRFQTVTGKGYRVGVMDVGRWRYVFSALGMFYGLVTLVLPYLTLVGVSFLKSLGMGLQRGNFTLVNYARVFTTDLAREAVINSTILAFVSATLCALIGAVVAYLVVRTTFRFGVLLDYITVLPMGIAGTAFAVGVLGAYMVPPLRSLGLYGTLWIILVTYMAKYMPLAVRNCQSGLLQLSNDLEESARISGADWVRTTCLITFPLVRSAMINGWILVFLSSFSELSASIILRNIGTSTVATAILDLWDGAGGYQDAAALGSLVFLLVAGVFFLPNLLFGRSPIESQ